MSKFKSQISTINHHPSNSSWFFVLTFVDFVKGFCYSKLHGRSHEAREGNLGEN
ncbi:MAG: hypothetical protein WCS69_13515 [Ignavibacteriaceae bacterium]